MNPRVETLWSALKAAGARRTPPRDIVLATMAATGEHLTVGDIHGRAAGRFPGIDASTVYRTVLFLAEHQVVHVLAYAGPPRYGLADHPHHHAVCTGCGSVTEMPAGSLLPGVPDAFQPIQQGQTVLGTCADCRPRRTTQTVNDCAGRPKDAP
jgi:Fe2+ or Zn2+ uptake regulation protein